MLYIVLPLLIAAAGAAFYTSSKNFSLLSASIKRRFILDTELVAGKISAENARGVSVAKSAAVSGEILFGNRVASIKMMRKMLEAFPSFAGAAIGYSINSDFNDFRADLGLKNVRDGKDVYSDGALDSYDFASNKSSATIDEWIAASEGGRFGAVWTKPDGDPMLSPLYDTDAAPYIAALRKRIDAGEKDLNVVSEPYISAGKNMLVEYAAAIITDGRYSGQVAFACDMSRIQGILSSARSVGDEEYFLISPQERIVASSRFENIKTMSIDDIYLDNAGNLVQSFLREEKGALVRDELAASKMNLAKYNGFYAEVLRYACNLAKNDIVAEAADRKISVYANSASGVRYYVDVSIVRAGKWVVVHICPEVDFFTVVASSLSGSLAIILAICLAGAIGTVVLSGFVRRVSACRDAAENIADGVFADLPALAPSDDESGRLARAMSRAVKRMLSVLESVQALHGEISEASKSISASMENYAFQSNEIDLQTAKILNTLKSALDADKTLLQSVEKIEGALKSAADSGESARKDIGYVDDLAGEFSRNASSSMRRNANLNDRIKGITGISAEISKVSDESNLLSLNAAIEAEKSGRRGGGFAVIAREINRLSENISLSSAEMKNIVSEIENTISYDSSESGRLLENLSDFTLKYSKILANMDSAAAQIKSAIPAVERLAADYSSNASDASRAFDMLSEMADTVKKLNLLRGELTASAERLSEKVRKVNAAVAEIKRG